uniref:BAP29/BAP31 transmembrane domain-containing protein n=1 Tax=Chromera velia CCMP2878 TaxID=1169474 RepID=A0A0G4FAI9_9ALVE|mmetsp:Transcript_509/g.1123  ORF Transcript_509/g.1123 Transcript_509/m.1123 type:complete len:221 (+) Transcript_509:206-868(+)|eukprot:Cvel_183.t1-p1 / transcript=Cvel_183.t1 / gene=Cvel_183 / organism=Chromera_velia_CCMP2878 / gene_product=hypothetical protein / transcript_product=hypothetical protein / location=Cvel_scaffold11:99826-103633(-) / protein_length=220 / sequence_SO=supercontig / SO=protein_coding / is_pseudo=false
MKFEAFVLIPLGVVMILMLLSGIRFVQGLAVKLGHLRVAMNGVGITLNIMCFAWAGIRFAFEAHQLARYSSWRTAVMPAMFQHVMPPALDEKFKMKLWRLERNYWICLFTLVIWLTVMRSSTVFSWFWKQIDGAKSAGGGGGADTGKKPSGSGKMPAPSAPPMPTSIPAPSAPPAEEVMKGADEEGAANEARRRKYVAEEGKGGGDNPGKGKAAEASKSK